MLFEEGLMSQNTNNSNKEHELRSEYVEPLRLPRGTDEANDADS
jgi:hypothetical protein